MKQKKNNLRPDPCVMQFRFDFARFDFEPWRAVLSVLVDGMELSHHMPFDQLVNSMISGRTKDAVSARAGVAGL